MQRILRDTLANRRLSVFSKLSNECTLTCSVSLVIQMLGGTHNMGKASATQKKKRIFLPNQDEHATSLGSNAASQSIHLTKMH